MFVVVVRVFYNTRTDRKIVAMCSGMLRLRFNTIAGLIVIGYRTPTARYRTQFIYKRIRVFTYNYSTYSNEITIEYLHVIWAYVFFLLNFLFRFKNFYDFLIFFLDTRRLYRYTNLSAF